MEDLKQIRIMKNLTQVELSKILGISLRSYKSYENDESKKNTPKYNYILEKLNNINVIDEEHGIVSLNYIETKCTEILKKYNVDFCYLFGSYAKGTPSEKSDIDLLISTNLTGLKFYGLIEELRTSLNKKIDLLDLNQLKDNVDLTKDILKYGIKIYG